VTIFLTFAGIEQKTLMVCGQTLLAKRRVKGKS